MRKLNEIVVHCSATPTGSLESIRRYHTKVRGWSDVGYHYIIERNGSTRKGRPIHKMGAHVKGANRYTIGICLIGKDTFTDQQYGALERLVETLCKTYSTIKAVKPHNWYPSAKSQGKTCPNFHIPCRITVPKGIEVY